MHWLPWAGAGAGPTQVHEPWIIVSRPKLGFSWCDMWGDSLCCLALIIIDKAGTRVSSCLYYSIRDRFSFCQIFVDLFATFFTNPLSKMANAIPKIWEMVCQNKWAHPTGSSYPMWDQPLSPNFSILRFVYHWMLTTVVLARVPTLHNDLLFMSMGTSWRLKTCCKVFSVTFISVPSVLLLNHMSSFMSRSK